MYARNPPLNGSQSAQAPDWTPADADTGLQGLACALILSNCTVSLGFPLNGPDCAQFCDLQNRCGD